MTDQELGATIEAIWRIESARVVASVARLTHDLDQAEDVAQDALLAALEAWPSRGLPDNPGAWLMTAAKRRALDHLRHQTMAAPKHAELARELDAHHALSEQAFAERIDAALDDDIDDDVLRLLFTACHPVLSPDARAALTLKVVGGLTTQEIARAYLKPEATIAQRIVRAKRTLFEAHVPFEMPGGAALAPRLSSVLEVIYLIFNEGYAATAGDQWMRPDLCDEALRLGRVLAGLMPEESEVHGLTALMEIQASRLPARMDAKGDPILLPDQDRGRWDRLLIRRGLATLERAGALPGVLGPYTLQAAIAACHARATIYEETDWTRIAALYEALAQIAPSPVVALNRAVALGMAFGPAAGLELVDALLEEPTLAHYHLLPSVRGDLLARLDRIEEARAEFERAATLTRNARERALLLARAAGCNEAETLPEKPSR
ncbi:RNA polymerase sigma factor, sigma-70 family [Modicisalibacter ilicicola DSM 19980]|uniref:RNA polymerase sigma factor, sigma-70 family n=1 Tax=Modicisalibacter ilicicola DSM 19980 TaxID=1121942 RepID=A0A1M4UDV5_9GAMM|nr:RNA polymerase sigma factor [Halomonas ilicicola]SHE54750.1 RNA polymerase sigma factor, sigma-70 family [Halomonas ilicicola DSM 19980]